MIMIAWKAIGVKPPTVTYAGVEQAVLERLLGLLLGKDMASVITTIQYVVNSVGVLDS
jgi:hypothetical protein